MLFAKIFLHSCHSARATLNHIQPNHVSLPLHLSVIGQASTLFTAHHTIGNFLLYEPAIVSKRPDTKYSFRTCCRPHLTIFTDRLSQRWPQAIEHHLKYIIPSTYRDDIQSEFADPSGPTEAHFIQRLSRWQCNDVP